MTDERYLRLEAGPYVFRARLELAKAPRTCEAILRLLPMTRPVVHARWSGEAVWMPFGAAHAEVPWEDPTSHPAPGELLLYPGGVSEMEILFPYGAARFASKAGQLAGNHFATVVEGLERLRPLGERVLHQGALDVSVRLEA